MTYPISAPGSNLGPRATGFLVGVGFVAVGALGLWKRDDLYPLTQLYVHYPQGSLRYGLFQIALPAVFVVIGIALMILSAA